MSTEFAELKERILRLLEKDREFRYAVAGLIGLDEVLKRLDRHEEQLVKIWERLAKIDEEIARLWSEVAKLREDMAKGFERHDRELAALREGQKKTWEEIEKLRRNMSGSFKRIDRHITALGARWGLESEESFRKSLRRILEKELGFKVERWKAYDELGVVYGYPSDVEIDVAVVNGKTILVEISSHVRASDVYIFKRKAELYREKTGKVPDRLIIVTPYADEKALEAAVKLGIEIDTKTG